MVKEGGGELTARLLLKVGSIELLLPLGGVRLVKDGWAEPLPMKGLGLEKA